MMADERKQRHGGCMVAAMAFLAVGSAFGALNPSAQTFYWTGAQDSYWTNANNWEMEDGSAAVTAPGVVGDLSKPEEWVGHKRDTAIFDGAKFKSLSALTLNVQGLLCVGYVTVQGATTPEISFGTSRDSSQCFYLYNSGADDTATAGSGGVFTIAADVVNMPIIPYPGLGGLFDNASSKKCYINYVNNAEDKTFTLLACGDCTKDPGANVTGNVTMYPTFTGTGDFSLGGTYAGQPCGDMNTSGQRYLTFNLSGQSSLLVTNFTRNCARYSIYGKDENEHTVTIAKGSRIYTNNRGYVQFYFGGNISFEGEGELIVADRGSSTTSYQIGIEALAYVKFGTKFSHVGSDSTLVPSPQDLLIHPYAVAKGSTVEFDNPNNVIQGGIRFDRYCNLVAGAVDKDASAIGGGPITICGPYSFTYTGGAATMTNVINYGVDGDNKMGGKFCHNGTGRLALRGGISFAAASVQNQFQFEVKDPEAELEIFGGLKDNTTSTSTGLIGDFTGPGRIILHGECSYSKCLNFGVDGQAYMTPVTLAPDATFVKLRDESSIDIRAADVTFAGPESGDVEVLNIPYLLIYTGPQIFRMKGRRSVKAVRTNFIGDASNRDITLYRETPAQQMYFPGFFAPTSGSKNYIRINGYASSEFTLDAAIRPYSSSYPTRSGVHHVASNGGVFGDDASGVDLSHDGKSTTGPITLAADSVTVAKLVQKGWPDSVVALGNGQKLSVSNLCRTVESGTLTIGNAVGVGTVSIDTVLKNEDSYNPIVINAAADRSKVDPHSIRVEGRGPVVINGPIVCDPGISIVMDDSSGSVTLNNTASVAYTQAYVYRGTLRMGADNVIPPTTKVYLDTYGVLDLNDHLIDFSNVTCGDAQCKVINGSGHWTFAAGTTVDYTTLPLTTTAGDVVRISNPERVLTNPRSQFVLARFKDDIVNCPTLDPDVQQLLGSEWSLVADGNQLILQGPKRGLVLMVR